MCCLDGGRSHSRVLCAISHPLTALYSDNPRPSPPVDGSPLHSSPFGNFPPPTQLKCCPFSLSGCFVPSLPARNREKPADGRANMADVAADAAAAEVFQRLPTSVVPDKVGPLRLQLSRGSLSGGVQLSAID